MAFVCDRCGHCCREHRVPVTRQDVRRLAQAGSDVNHAVQWLRPEQVDLVGEPETLVRGPTGPRLAVLAHAPEGACVFLGSSGCSVHAVRPLACRCYPFDRPATPTFGRRLPVLGSSPDAMCPPESRYAATLSGDDAQDARHFAELVATRDEELGEQAEWVQRFNRRQRLRRQLGKRPLELAAVLASWARVQT